MLGRHAFALALTTSVVLAAAGCGGDSAPTVATGAAETSAASPPPAETSAPGTTATSSSEAKPYTSGRYGYTVEVPSDWLTPERFAEKTKGRWTGPLAPLDRGVDTFTDASVETRFFVAARRVGGKSTEAWSSELARGTPTLCGEPERRERAEIAGRPAVVRTYHCDDGYLVLLAAFVADRRGFGIGFAAPEGSEAADRERFDEIVSSLALER